MSVVNLPSPLSNPATTREPTAGREVGEVGEVGEASLAGEAAEASPAGEASEVSEVSEDRRAGVGAGVGVGVLGLRRVVELLVLLWGLLIVVVVAGRITFPLELEWMEGGSLHHALRLLQGEAIYAAPSIDFVPFLYTPLYPGLLALLSGLGLPLGLVLGRAVSVVAIVAIAAGLWRLVAAENKPRAHRAAAVGLFLAGYIVSFRWYDIARADSMMFALLLWGLVLARNARSGQRSSTGKTCVTAKESDDASSPKGSPAEVVGRRRGAWRRPLLAGVLVGLAFWTKQTAAVLIFASGLGVIASGLRGRFWELARYTLTVALIILGGLALGNAATGGWLWTYIYELHQTHGFNHERFERKTWGMLLHAGPFLGLLALTLVSDDIGRLVGRLRRGSRGTLGPLLAVFDRGEAAAGRRYWGVIAAFALLVSALGYSTQWAEPNAFIPAVIFGAAYLAVSLPVGGRRELWALALVACQLLFAVAVEPTYQPIQNRGVAALSESYRWQAWRRTIPDAEGRSVAAELRATLVDASRRTLTSETSETSDNEVLALARPWWSVLAGGRGHVASMGLSDVPKTEGVRLRRELIAELRSGRFAEAWFEGEPPRWLRGALTRRFRLEERRLDAARVRPWTGYMSEAGMVTPYRAPQIRLVRTGDRPRPAGAVVLADFEERTMPPGFRRQGRAFSPRPHAAVVGDLPILGPHGGVLLMGSALGSAGLSSTGTLESPPFQMSRGGALELLVGVSAGDPEGLGVTIEVLAEGDAPSGDGPSGDTGAQDVGEPVVSQRISVPLPSVIPWQLSELRWEVPPDLAGKRLRLIIADESRSAAIFIDDLWIVADAPPLR